MLEPVQFRGFPARGKTGAPQYSVYTSLENRLDTALVYCVFIHYYYLLYMVPTLSTSIPAVLVYSVYGTFVNSISKQCIYSITEVCILVQKLDTPTTTLCKIILYSPLPIYFPKWLYFFEMLLLLRGFSSSLSFSFPFYLCW